MNSDFKELLSAFNAAKVRYLVVGGYAVMTYTEPRYTKNLDLWGDATPKNARAVFCALKKFGAPLENLTEQDFAKEGHFYQIGRPPARVDILMSIDGVSFAEAWRARVPTEFGEVPTQVIPRKHLILNKRASGRPLDLIDATSLEESERIDEANRRKARRQRKQRPEGL
ncbi:MAG: hypothetical protein U0790_08900 [Isosphaeraceae bacterium]